MGDEASCDQATIRSVSLEGTGDRAGVSDCAFELAVQDTGRLVLQFDDGGGTRARMYLDQVPPKARIDLADVWIDDRGVAFPGGLELDGAEVILVNGIRMSGPDRLPDRVHDEGVVLGVTSTAGALLARPVNPRLPDLRVRVDSSTEIVTADGTPAQLSWLSFGDSVRVEGTAEHGLVLATRLTVPEPERSLSAELEEVLRASGLHDEAERALRALGGGAAPEVAREARRAKREARDRDDEDSDSDGKKRKR